MKILRKPQINAAVITVVSLFYAAMFHLVSGHAEFDRTLDHANTLKSAFWNTWTAFLKQGNLKYIGYAYIAVTIVIVIASFAKRRNYDEYQASILEKGIKVMGIALVVLFPIALLLVLSDPQYAIETVMFLVVVHWAIVLIADSVLALQWVKG